MTRGAAWQEGTEGGARVKGDWEEGRKSEDKWEVEKGRSRGVEGREGKRVEENRRRGSHGEGKWEEGRESEGERRRKWEGGR